MPLCRRETIQPIPTTWFIGGEAEHWCSNCHRGGTTANTITAFAPSIIGVAALAPFAISRAQLLSALTTGLSVASAYTPSASHGPHWQSFSHHWIPQLPHARASPGTQAPRFSQAPHKLHCPPEADTLFNTALSAFPCFHGVLTAGRGTLSSAFALLASRYCLFKPQTAHPLSSTQVTKPLPAHLRAPTWRGRCRNRHIAVDCRTPDWRRTVR